MTIGSVDSLALPGNRRMTGAGRARVVIALLVGCCIGVVGLAVLGQAPQVPGLDFTQSGHWVYSTGLQSALHVDGATGQVDAQAGVPGAAQGSQVVQGDSSGFVVGRSRITEFSKSTLSVSSASDAPAPEVPVGLEVAGGPYLVYRNAGQVVRLGDPTATVPAGGPLANPVATSDGTVWLLREDNGALCDLPRGSIELACPARLPQGHTGELTTVGDQPEVLDLTARVIESVGANGLGAGMPVGITLSATARVADNAVDGRLAVLDVGERKLVLIDPAGRSDPVTVPLGLGTYTGPVAVSHTVAVVDQTSHRMLTYDSRGKQTGTTAVPGPDGSSRLAAGQDSRIYVDSSDGSHVLVVNGQNGSVVDVNVNSQSSGTPAGGRPSDSQAASSPSTVDSPPVVANATPPGAPSGISAVAEDRSARVSWGAAKPNGAPVTAYRLSWSGGSMTVGGSTQHAIVAGLTNGTAYVFTVTAANSAGAGAAASSGSVVPGMAADAPSVSTSVSGTGLSVSWTTPDLHGAGLVHYLVSVTGQGEQAVSGTSASYSGLSGTVSVTVRAITQYGSSGGLLTGRAGSRSVSLPTVTAPTVKITGVRSTNALIVTVDAAGGAATCQANFLGAVSAWTACSGSTDLTISNVFWAGSITITVTIKNAVGSSSDSWTGTPGA
ncbi:MAG TPA: fibronectin type III domain-containing protein [Pseudonocardiaceae bacterium]|jgi:hypothetical protein|nr:fibronectin type III domain-containing protein [Pseudonocardiaceae bacterium]